MKNKDAVGPTYETERFRVDIDTPSITDTRSLSSFTSDTTFGAGDRIVLNQNTLNLSEPFNFEGGTIALEFDIGSKWVNVVKASGFLS